MPVTQHMKTAVLQGMVVYCKPSTLETEVGSFIVVENEQAEDAAQS